MPSIETGEMVVTDFGSGQVVRFRDDDSFYEIRLPFGRLFTRLISVPNDGGLSTSSSCGMELNAAYEAYERMRTLNLQVELAETGVDFSEYDLHSHCTECLRQLCRSQNKVSNNVKPTLVDADGRPRFPGLYKMRLDRQESALRKKLQPKKGEPCLLCAAPTCSATHASPDFRREGITVCQSCVDIIRADNHSDVQRHAKDLVNLYDRGVLLLRYSHRYVIPEIAATLEQQTVTNNTVKVAGSSVGLVSGVLGVAGACTLLTPLGPPLLLASLVTGGTSTAVQAGSTVRKYYGERVADRLLAVYGMVHSVLQELDRMKQTVLLPYIDQAAEDLSIVTRVGTKLGSYTMSSLATNFVVQESAYAGRFVSRASAAAAQGLMFAQIAGGALSAATILLEVRELTRTVGQIRSGNPNEKAQLLRSLPLDELPSTETVSSFCQTYVKVKQAEQNAAAATDMRLIEEVVDILELGSSRHDSSLRDLPLVERIRHFKERNAREKAEVDLVV
jgi:hypothetical protein